jgi:hypothetical protein
MAVLDAAMEGLLSISIVKYLIHDRKTVRSWSNESG